MDHIFPSSHTGWRNRARLGAQADGYGYVRRVWGERKPFWLLSAGELHLPWGSLM